MPESFEAIGPPRLVLLARSLAQMYGGKICVRVYVLTPSFSMPMRRRLMFIVCAYEDWTAHTNMSSR